MLTRYTYQPLDPSKEEIRFVTLHPGQAGEAICISILHAPFNIRIRSQSPSISRVELQETLDRPWSASETLEGKIIFHYEEGDGTIQTSWSHPSLANTTEHHALEHGLKWDTRHPDFEALSYTWGSLEELAEIFVLPSEASSREQLGLQIGTNLHAALVHLRRLDSPRTLWIDALCINQDDLEERNKQVKRMRHIYNLARRVVVWLGPSGSSSELALQTLEYLGKQLEYTSSYQQLPAPNCSEKSWWKEKGALPFSAQAWEAVATLILRPWFDRLWVVQEIQLANSSAIIQCGDREVSWYHLRRAFIKCRSMSKVVPQLSSAMIQNRIVHLWYLSTDLTKCRFNMLFSIAGKCKCGDPRDHVYALMALLPQSLAARIEPQYSLSINEVFLQTMLASIATTRRLNLIGFQGIKAKGQDLPSWVPNLSGTESQYRRIPWAAASGCSAAHTSYKPPNELHVTGIHHGTIEGVHTGTWYDFPSAVRIAWKCWASSNDTKVYPTGENIYDAFAWVLSCGRLSERWPYSPELPALRDARQFFQSICEGESSSRDFGYENWLSDMSRTLEEKQFFRCTNGYVGWGHGNVQPGDKVGILLGYQNPLILRPMEASSFQIVGRCYVHGIMDAQSVLGPLNWPWKVVVRRSTWLDGASSLVERYVNCETKEETWQDPRLGKIPDDWEIVQKEDDTGLGVILQHYKNRETGEIINSDPRLLPEALRARDIQIDTFILV